MKKLNSSARLGVEFRYNTEIKTQSDLERLEHEFDRIFLGVGLGAARRLGIPGDDHPNVIDALQFIAQYKTADPPKVSERVAVIGAGNTAIDAANAARRLGAASVAILYRRSERDMSAFAFEYEHAKQEGVHFLWRVMPVRIQSDDRGIHSIECAQTAINEDGVVVRVPGSNFKLHYQQVIYAIGQSPLLELLSECRCLKLNDGRVVVDRATGATSSPKYFAGGDCVNGGREVVDAVADGKRSGIAIAEALEAVHA